MAIAILCLNRQKCRSSDSSPLWMPWHFPHRKVPQVQGDSLACQGHLPLKWRARHGNFLWGTPFALEKPWHLKPYCSQPSPDVGEGVGALQAVDPLCHLQRDRAEPGDGALRRLTPTSILLKSRGNQPLDPERSSEVMQSKLLIDGSRKAQRGCCDLPKVSEPDPVIVTITTTNITKLLLCPMHSSKYLRGINFLCFHNKTMVWNTYCYILPFYKWGKVRPRDRRMKWQNQDLHWGNGRPERTLTALTLSFLTQGSYRLVLRGCCFLRNGKTWPDWKKASITSLSTRMFQLQILVSIIISGIFHGFHLIH